MDSLFETLAQLTKPSYLKTLDIILSEIDKPFKYCLSFSGNGYYSQDGQLWGNDKIEITKSKTSICVSMKKAEDVHDFKSIAFIRSIDELKEVINNLSKEYQLFFQNFGQITIYK